MTTRRNRDALYEVAYKVHGATADRVRQALIGALARRDPDATEVRVTSIRVRRLKRATLGVLALLALTGGA